jgi:hypothetical protein
LKETNWEPDFESLEKLDLTKVKIMWIIRICLQELEEVLPYLISGAAKKHQILINDNP